MDTPHPASRFTVPALLIALGLVIGGLALGSQIKATRQSDRFVAVKGLVERQVKSDLAIWPLSCAETGDDLALLSAKIESDKTIVLDFLRGEGIETAEVEAGVLRVIDSQANEYGGANRPLHRYIVEQQIVVRTPRVDQVAKAAQKTIQLLQKGIALTGSEKGRVIYKFTGLNAIKPDMITESTRNARAAADRFASDSGSRVGAIRQANQGTFSILAPDSGGDAGPDYGNNADYSLMKTVRVVTSIDYYLDR